ASAASGTDAAASAVPECTAATSSAAAMAPAVERCAAWTRRAYGYPATALAAATPNVPFHAPGGACPAAAATPFAALAGSAAGSSRGGETAAQGLPLEGDHQMGRDRSRAGRDRSRRLDVVRQVRSCRPRPCAARRQVDQ